MAAIGKYQRMYLGKANCLVEVASLKKKKK
jgi:hypothetical protein